ncbi:MULTISPECIES: response regulator [Pirellulaceae]|nr:MULTISPECIES: response regulator [Pirellulaceae]
MQSTNRTILHVDDSAMIRQLVHDHYTELGYQVISIADPREVMAALMENNCQVVISDIEMEPIDGLTLLREIKKEDGGVSVIMLSMRADTNTILRSMRWGADAYIFKPLNDFTRLDAAVMATFRKYEAWWDALQEGRNRNSRNEPSLA